MILAPGFEEPPCRLKDNRAETRQRHACCYVFLCFAGLGVEPVCGRRVGRRQRPVFGWPRVSVRLADAPSGRSLPWVLHSFSSFWFLADRSRNQLTGAGRARNRVTSRSRRSTKRGCLARCLAHTTDASSNRISARFVRSWQSPLSQFFFGSVM